MANTNKNRYEAAAEKRTNELLRRTLEATGLDSSKKDVETKATGGNSKQVEAQAKKKATFGFKAATDDVERWKLYAHISGVKISDFATAAINDYIDSHPLTTEQKQNYSSSASNIIDEL